MIAHSSSIFSSNNRIVLNVPMNSAGFLMNSRWLFPFSHKSKCNFIVFSISCKKHNGPTSDFLPSDVTSSEPAIVHVPPLLLSTMVAKWLPDTGKNKISPFGLTMPSSSNVRIKPFSVLLGSTTQCAGLVTVHSTKWILKGNIFTTPPNESSKTKSGKIFSQGIAISEAFQGGFTDRCDIEIVLAFG